MKVDSLVHRTKLLFTKYFAVVMVGVVLIILLGGYVLVIKQPVSAIQKIGVVDLKLKQDELIMKQETVKRFEALQKRYEQISSDQLKQLSYLLPHEAEIPNVVIELKEFVKNNNLVLGGIDVGPLGATVTNAATATTTPSNVAVKTLTISLAISGIDSYNGLKSFLDALARQQPLMELTSLSYTPGNDSYNLNLSTYYQ